MSTCLSADELNRFHKLPATERRKLASSLLNGWYEGLQHLIASRAEFTDLKGLVAYVSVKQQAEDSILFWRREMYHAAWAIKNQKDTTGAGRSPAGKAHGCAALASLAGSFAEALNRSGNAGKVAT